MDFGDWKSWVLVGLTCRRRNSSISGSRYEAAFVPRMVACPCLPRHPDHLWIDFVLVDVRAELMSPGRWSCDFPALFRIDVVFVDVSVVPFSPSRWPCDFPPLFRPCTFFRFGDLKFVHVSDAVVS